MLDLDATGTGSDIVYLNAFPKDMDSTSDNTQWVKKNFRGWFSYKTCIYVFFRLISLFLYILSPAHYPISVQISN